MSEWCNLHFRCNTDGLKTADFFLCVKQFLTYVVDRQISKFYQNMKGNWEKFDSWKTAGKETSFPENQESLNKIGRAGKYAANINSALPAPEAGLTCSSCGCPNPPLHWGTWGCCMGAGRSHSSRGRAFPHVSWSGSGNPCSPLRWQWSTLETERMKWRKKGSKITLNQNSVCVIKH